MMAVNRYKRQPLCGGLKKNHSSVVSLKQMQELKEKWFAIYYSSPLLMFFVPPSFLVPHVPLAASSVYRYIED